jgi:hypothetical protein
VQQTSRWFMSLRDATDCDLFAAELKATAGNPAPHYLGSVVLDAQHWEICEGVAKARLGLARLRGLNGPQFRRGDVKDLRNDTVGTMGELIASQLLAEHASDIAPLVCHKADASVDVVLAGKRIDAKTMDTGAAWCNVNQRAHAKKRPDAYLLVNLVRDDVADLHVVAASALTTPGCGWYAVDGFAPYYRKRIAQLQALEPLPPKEELAAA